MPSTQRPAGRDFLPFSGKVSGGILITGAYRATITAFDASGTASRVATANFSLVKKPVLRRHPASKKRASSRRRRHTIRRAL